MKKFAIFTIAIMAVLALAAAPVFAGEGCTSHAKTTDAKMTSASADCAKSCSADNMAACAAKLGISVEECKALCAELGDKHDFQQISIKGMTCGGCESGIKTALVKAPGVLKVVRVSHKDGMAVVAVDREKFNGESTTKMITDKGYQAEIIPAVAVTTDAPAKMTDGGAKSCSKTCTAAEKAACTGKASTDKTASKEETKAGGTK